MKVCKCNPNVHTKLDVCPVCDEPTVDATSLHAEDEIKYSPKFMKPSNKLTQPKVKAYTEADYQNGVVPDKK